MPEEAAGSTHVDCSPPDSPAGHSPPRTTMANAASVDAVIGSSSSHAAPRAARTGISAADSDARAAPKREMATP